MALIEGPELVKLLAVPYVHKGRDRKGWDCYGLYRCMLLEEFGVQAASYVTEYPHERSRLADVVTASTIARSVVRDWVRVELGNEARGCAIVFNIAGQPLHVGYVLEPGTMLHAMSGRGTCIERYNSINWTKRIEGIYKWN